MKTPAETTKAQPGPGTLAFRLSAQMKGKGLKAAAVARMAGVGPDYLSHLVRGRRDRPSDEIITRLANALGCDVDWLASGRTPMSGENDGEAARLGEDAHPAFSQSIRPSVERQIAEVPEGAARRATLADLVNAIEEFGKASSADPRAWYRAGSWATVAAYITELRRRLKLPLPALIFAALLGMTGSGLADLKTATPAEALKWGEALGLVCHKPWREAPGLARVAGEYSSSTPYRGLDAPPYECLVWNGGEKTVKSVSYAWSPSPTDTNATASARRLAVVTSLVQSAVGKPLPEAIAKVVKAGKVTKDATIWTTDGLELVCCFSNDIKGVTWLQFTIRQAEAAPAPAAAPPK